MNRTLDDMVFNARTLEVPDFVKYLLLSFSYWILFRKVREMVEAHDVLCTSGAGSRVRAGSGGGGHAAALRAAHVDPGSSALAMSTASRRCVDAEGCTTLSRASQ